MKLVLMNRLEIKAKNGQPWVKYDGVSKDGKVVTLWFSPEDEVKYKLSSEAVVSKAAIDKLFKENDGAVVDAEFNERGRLESIA